jgi:hypothetical protein
MGDEGIFVTTAEVQRKVGANVSSVSNAEAYINQYVAEAESLINIMTEVNWSDIYTSLDADLRDLLKMAAGAKAAMMVISYDLSVIPTQREAETRLDVLNNEFDRAIAELKEQSQKGFLKGDN